MGFSKNLIGNPGFGIYSLTSCYVGPGFRTYEIKYAWW